ncbi:hypothetical protein [Deinococcus aquaticus]|uniref:hypothetical protein n=1 Tax=Deinococcus aquaticus TaxID=328692 RepID=UPI003621C45E
MKKIVALGLATALFTSTALAGTASAPITVNATVLSSCMFDSAATGSASFSYDAITGSASAMSGSATLYCNSGTTITLNTAANASLILTSASKSKSLNASYTLTSVATPEREPAPSPAPTNTSTPLHPAPWLVSGARRPPPITPASSTLTSRSDPTPDEPAES